MQRGGRFAAFAPATLLAAHCCFLLLLLLMMMLLMLCSVAAVAASTCFVFRYLLDWIPAPTSTQAFNKERLVRRRPRSHHRPINAATGCSGRGDPMKQLQMRLQSAC